MFRVLLGGLLTIGLFLNILAMSLLFAGADAAFNTPLVPATTDSGLLGYLYFFRPHYARVAKAGLLALVVFLLTYSFAFADELHASINLSTVADKYSPMCRNSDQPRQVFRMRTSSRMVTCPQMVTSPCRILYKDSARVLLLAG